MLHGTLRLRSTDRKWKNRYCVTSSLTANVVEGLSFSFYKNEKTSVRQDSQPKESYQLNKIYGLESGFSIDREVYTLAVLAELPDTAKFALILAFRTQNEMLEWEHCIRQYLGARLQMFRVKVAKSTLPASLPLDLEARIHVSLTRFCVCIGLQPTIVLACEVGHVRRYGKHSNRFGIEIGRKGGMYAGSYTFVSSQCQRLQQAFDEAKRQQQTTFGQQQTRTTTPPSTKPEFDSASIYSIDSATTATTPLLQKPQFITEIPVTGDPTEHFAEPNAPLRSREQQRNSFGEKGAVRSSAQGDVVKPVTIARVLKDYEQQEAYTNAAFVADGATEPESLSPVTRSYSDGLVQLHGAKNNRQRQPSDQPRRSASTKRSQEKNRRQQRSRRRRSAPPGTRRGEQRCGEETMCNHAYSMPPLWMTHEYYNWPMFLWPTRGYCDPFVAEELYRDCMFRRQRKNSNRMEKRKSYSGLPTCHSSHYCPLRTPAQCNCSVCDLPMLNFHPQSRIPAYCRQCHNYINQPWIDSMRSYYNFDTLFAPRPPPLILHHCTDCRGTRHRHHSSPTAKPVPFLPPVSSPRSPPANPHYINQCQLHLHNTAPSPRVTVQRSTSRPDSRLVALREEQQIGGQQHAPMPRPDDSITPPPPDPVMPKPTTASLSRRVACPPPPIAQALEDVTSSQSDIHIEAVEELSTARFYADHSAASPGHSREFERLARVKPPAKGHEDPRQFVQANVRPFNPTQVRTRQYYRSPAKKQSGTSTSTATRPDNSNYGGSTNSLCDSVAFTDDQRHSIATGEHNCATPPHSIHSWDYMRPTPTGSATAFAPRSTVSDQVLYNRPPNLHAAFSSDRLRSQSDNTKTGGFFNGPFRRLTKSASKFVKVSGSNNSSHTQQQSAPANLDSRSPFRFGAPQNGAGAIAEHESVLTPTRDRSSSGSNSRQRILDVFSRLPGSSNLKHLQQGDSICSRNSPTEFRYTSPPSYASRNAPINPPQRPPKPPRSMDKKASVASQISRPSLSESLTEPAPTTAPHTEHRAMHDRKVSSARDKGAAKAWISELRKPVGVDVSYEQYDDANDTDRTIGVEPRSDQQSARMKQDTTVVTQSMPVTPSSSPDWGRRQSGGAAQRPSPRKPTDLLIKHGSSSGWISSEDGSHGCSSPSILPASSARTASSGGGSSIFKFPASSSAGAAMIPEARSRSYRSSPQEPMGPLGPLSAPPRDRIGEYLELDHSKPSASHAITVHHSSGTTELTIGDGEGSPQKTEDGSGKKSINYIQIDATLTMAATKASNERQHERSDHLPTAISLQSLITAQPSRAGSSRGGRVRAIMKRASMQGRIQRSHSNANAEELVDTL